MAKSGIPLWQLLSILFLNNLIRVVLQFFHENTSKQLRYYYCEAVVCVRVKLGSDIFLNSR